MKNKLIFRILGALASALIIVSVFIPFVSVTGYSQSLWQAHSSVGTIYLPIMIIVFGAIGVIFFSINIKTELAYTSSGALLFFLIMQTIPIIDQGTFGTLSVGYYCLVIGTILTGIMAFLCNLKTKQKVVTKQEEEVVKEVSMIDQIDKLYNDQSVNTPNVDNNILDNIIQPLPVQENINTLPVENNIPTINQNEINNQIQPVNINNNNNFETPVSLDNLNNNVQSEPINVINEEVVENNQPIATSVEENPQPIVEQQSMEPVAINSNPVIQEFNQPVVEQAPQQNPVIAEFETPNVEAPVISEVNPVTQQVNPAIADFGTPSVDVPATAEENPVIQQVNPVIAEFEQPTQNQSMFQISQQNIEPPKDEEPNKEIPVVQPLQPLDGSSNVNIMSAQTNNNDSNLDIFG